MPRKFRKGRLDKSGTDNNKHNPPARLILFGLGNVGRFSNSKMKARAVLQVPPRVRLWT